MLARATLPRVLLPGPGSRFHRRLARPIPASTAKKPLDDLARRRKYKEDFRFYAPRALYIRTKAGEILPLRLNAAQEYLHTRIEDQLKTLGKVRALIVKGRQQGCSTYVEGRFYWKVSHRRGIGAFILTHHDDATTNLFNMAKRYHDLCPAPLKPQTAAANAKELFFNKLDSGYKVGTAGSKGVGRSFTLQYFHGSEVAYWPFADTHLAGVLQAVADFPATEIILESTATGKTGVFFDKCKEALLNHPDYEEIFGEPAPKDASKEESEYQVIFIPWYWQPEYRKPVSRSFEKTSEEEVYAEKYGVDDEQIMWRRGKIKELLGVHVFRHEYPATLKEAFSAEVPGALWHRETIEETRVAEAPPLRRIVVAVDPSGGEGPTHDEVGIVAGGIGYDGHVYVLRDVSGNMGANRWGVKVVATYDRLEADRIVGEKNFGGDMVEHTLRTVREKISYKNVTASRGKRVRAEPVSALYDQGMVHHVGSFIALEDEMMTWQPDSGQPSPNRMDALVWLVTELLLEGKTVKVAPPAAGPHHSPFPSEQE